MSNPFSKEDKLFTVVTPIYKDAYKTLDKFFTALSQQDYKHFEVVVVFDGENKEGLDELLKQMKKHKDITVHYYTKKWGGAPAARNYGAERGNGDFFTFLDPDVYLYPETLRIWASEFEKQPDKDVVWGLYDIDMHGERRTVGMPILDPQGNVDYWSFRFSNYCSGANPVRREAYVGWDESVKSLQDWDMWTRMLKKDNWQGKKFSFINRPFFITEPPHEGGISDDSHKNWLERLNYVKKKNGIQQSTICVVSLGAPFHGLHVAKKLGADYLPMPSFKPHAYKAIYLLGFYPTAARAHGEVFANDGYNAKKIIHWIGTDTHQLWWKTSFGALKALREEWKKPEYVMLTEVQHMHDEMKELGIDTKIIPIPPQTLYKPMPLPEKFTIGIYENPTQNMYHEQLMEHVARSLPDIEFKFFGDETKKGQKYDNVEHLGWVDLDEWLPKLSANLRITVHDGLSLTAVQFLSAGRNVIANYAIKGAIEAGTDRKSIVEGIRKAQQTPLDPKISQYWIKELDFKKFKKAIEELV